MSSSGIIRGMDPPRGSRQRFTQQVSLTPDNMSYQGLAW
jgi:hypothetical protein